jgi:membrane protease YdiL (CAAX protease family)
MPKGNSMLEYSFVPAFILLPLIVRFVLGRPAWSVAVPAWPPRVAEYGHGVVMGLVIALAGLAVSAPFLSYQFEGFSGLASAGMFAVAIMLAGFVIQTAFEELLFRGLIAQFTRRLTNFMPLVIGLQAILFGAMHVTNIKDWGGSIWGITPYVMIGLAWGWAAWRTGSILIPAALHFVNNANNVFLVGTKGDIVQSIAPMTINTPTISQAALIVAFNAIATVVIVEAYMRWRAKQNANS